MQGSFQGSLHNSASSFAQYYYFSHSGVKISKINTRKSLMAKKPGVIKKTFSKFVDSKDELSNNDFVEKICNSIMYSLFSNLPISTIRTKPTAHGEKGSWKVQDNKIMITIPCFPANNSALDEVIYKTVSVI